MSKKNTGKTGRPPAAQNKIDEKVLKDLLKFYPSKQEAADWFDVSPSSLERFINKAFGCSFDDFRDKSFVKTKIAIKRKQIQKALTGDNVMLVWCGKQYLGQMDKMDQKQETKISGSVLVPAMTKEQARKILEEVRKRDKDAEEEDE